MKFRRTKSWSKKDQMEFKMSNTLGCAEKVRRNLENAHKNRLGKKLRRYLEDPETVDRAKNTLGKLSRHKSCLNKKGQRKFGKNREWSQSKYKGKNCWWLSKKVIWHLESTKKLVEHNNVWRNLECAKKLATRLSKKKDQTKIMRKKKIKINTN